MRATTKNMITSALCLALCLLLPFLTGQIQQLGNALLPMHIPVLLCGFVCGPWWALLVGAVAPILRFFLFHMPPLFPTGLAMCVELATYGLVSGLLWRLSPRHTTNLYLALLCAMLSGRIVWGATMAALTFLGAPTFTLAIFWAKAFATAIPGIILQIVLLPPLVLSLRRAGLMEQAPLRR